MELIFAFKKKTVLRSAAILIFIKGNVGQVAYHRKAFCELFSLLPDYLTSWCI